MREAASEAAREGQIDVLAYMDETSSPRDRYRWWEPACLAAAKAGQFDAVVFLAAKETCTYDCLLKVNCCISANSCLDLATRYMYLLQAHVQAGSYAIGKLQLQTLVNVEVKNVLSSSDAAHHYDVGS